MFEFAVIGLLIYIAYLIEQGNKPKWQSMSEFEKAAMRIMGVILIGCLIILYLQLLGCAPNPPKKEEPIRDYIDEVSMENYA